MLSPQSSLRWEDVRVVPDVLDMFEHSRQRSVPVGLV